MLPIHGPSFRWRGHRRRSLSGIAGELLELLDKLAGGWAIGRIVAAVRVHESPIGRENEVAAELQHVFPGLALVYNPSMETITRNVRDIDANERLALERVLGRPLHENQQVIKW